MYREIISSNEAIIKAKYLTKLSDLIEVKIITAAIKGKNINTLKMPGPTKSN